MAKHVMRDTRSRQQSLNADGVECGRRSAWCPERVAHLDYSFPNDSDAAFPTRQSASISIYVDARVLHARSATYSLPRLRGRARGGRRRGCSSRIPIAERLAELFFYASR